MPEEEHLRESWFAKPAVFSVPPPASVAPPALPPERAHGATFLYGAAAGAFGGAAAILFAGFISGRVGHPANLAGLIGRTSGHGEIAGLTIGALVGAVLGGLMALVMRHSRRFIARLIFGAASSALLWFCVHVVLLSQRKATLPLVPMLLGACVYGACVALVPPSRA